MSTLQLISAAGGALLTLINLLNIFISQKTRADIAELKLSMAETRAKDKEELRDWTDEEFMRRDAIEAKLDALRARLAGG
jgi:hypothetical protein